MGRLFRQPDDMGGPRRENGAPAPDLVAQGKEWVLQVGRRHHLARQESGEIDHASGMQRVADRERLSGEVELDGRGLPGLKVVHVVRERTQHLQRITG